MGFFHDSIVFSELSESACGYQHEQLVYGVQECDRSIVIQYDYVFVLVDENNFRHQQSLCRIRGHQLGSHSLGDGCAFGTRLGLV